MSTDENQPDKSRSPTHARPGWVDLVAAAALGALAVLLAQQLIPRPGSDLAQEIVWREDDVVIAEPATDLDQSDIPAPMMTVPMGESVMEQVMREERERQADPTAAAIREQTKYLREAEAREARRRVLE